MNIILPQHPQVEAAETKLGEWYCTGMPGAEFEAVERYHVYGTVQLQLNTGHPELLEGILGVA